MLHSIRGSAWDWVAVWVFVGESELGVERFDIFLGEAMLRAVGFDVDAPQGHAELVCEVPFDESVGANETPSETFATLAEGDTLTDNAQQAGLLELGRQQGRPIERDAQVPGQRGYGGRPFGRAHGVDVFDRVLRLDPTRIGPFAATQSRQ